MKQQVSVDGVTIADLEAALGRLKLTGLPDDAVVRVRTSFAVSSDGGHAKYLSASTDEKSSAKQK